MEPSNNMEALIALCPTGMFGRQVILSRVIFDIEASTFTCIPEEIQKQMRNILKHIKPHVSRDRDNDVQFWQYELPNNQSLVVFND